MAETWTVQKILNWTVEYFTSKNIPEPRLGAELLLADVLKCKRIELYVQFERILSADERTAYRNFVQRRTKREPVQYILGETEFMGIPFKVSTGVLIPRQDTELLVDSVIEYLKEHQLKSPNILDIGTGSGCIAISLKKYFSDAAIYALEKSETALAIAKENAALNNVELQLVESDFFRFAEGASQKFDIIVSNPPYISQTDWSSLQPEVQSFEPREALYGGNDGMDFYRQMVPLTKALLSSPGTVFLETGYDQAAKVGNLLQTAGCSIEILTDYNGIDRVVKGLYST